jgi:hypothetical protein
MPILGDVHLSIERDLYISLYHRTGFIYISDIQYPFVRISSIGLMAINHTTIDPTSYLYAWKWSIHTKCHYRPNVRDLSRWILGTSSCLRACVLVILSPRPSPKKTRSSFIARLSFGWYVIFQWDFQDPKMEVLYHIVGHILWGYCLT